MGLAGNHWHTPAADKINIIRQTNSDNNTSAGVGDGVRV